MEKRNNVGKEGGKKRERDREMEKRGRGGREERAGERAIERKREMRVRARAGDRYGEMVEIVTKPPL